VPYYLARASDLSLTTSGAVLATNWVGAVIAAPIAGRLVGRVPARGLAVAGALLVGIGLLLIAGWDATSSTPTLIAALIVQGIGVGLFQLAYVDIVAATMPLHSRGVAGSLAMMTRTLGVVGAASMLTLLFEGLAASHGFMAAFERSFELAALLAFAMVGLLAWSARRGRDPG
jgi:MFS family permease